MKSYFYLSVFFLFLFQFDWKRNFKGLWIELSNFLFYSHRNAHPIILMAASDCLRNFLPIHKNLLGSLRKDFDIGFCIISSRRYVAVKIARVRQKKNKKTKTSLTKINPETSEKRRKKIFTGDPKRDFLT